MAILWWHCLKSVLPHPVSVLTWTSEPGGGVGLGIGGWGTGKVVTEGLGWSSGWGCWRTWRWWAQQHPMASVHSGPWWPLQPLSSYQSGWSPRLGSHLRGQQITNKQGSPLLHRVYMDTCCAVLFQSSITISSTILGEKGTICTTNNFI